MSVPIETVVELLMENLPNNWMWTLDGKSVSGSSRDELEKAVRTYLETLVPAPKLLSECEEFVWFLDTDGTPVRRVGDSVDYPMFTSITSPDQIKVFQPVNLIDRGW
ncbi:hypothetical protein UFOVP1004_57 [uncultured Caudovirales phage]|uniref:Uncharacterized protein n=1 Tax=uncultured Caudovirales phage TaxID=2100421 RepID=A0A6J5Q6I2_9CAUD|nr:hypothetical protein UFOVP1004_57 [uncultured Caudovirales phage]